MEISVPPGLWQYLPKFELNRFRPINFFPAYLTPDEWKRKKLICLGTKNRTLGDALILSSLPRKLKQAYPDLVIQTYHRGFNPVIFSNNPFVTGVSLLPRELFGDDCCWGSGHHIQLKEQFFGLEVSSDPKPEIFLSPNEIHWAEKELGTDRNPKPIAIIHINGHTHHGFLSADAWIKVVQRWKDKIRFWQIGAPGHQQIPGCEGYFFSVASFWTARKLFALFSKSSLFLGIDSGPMHVARAFDIPSMILVAHCHPEKAFEARKKLPYFLCHHIDTGFMYQKNKNFFIPEKTETQLHQEIDDFFDERVALLL